MPRRVPKISIAMLVGAALLSLGTWSLLESQWRALTHPLYSQMVHAARTMELATRVIAAEKSARGLLQPPAIDVNRTGLIGPEFSEITTTLGVLAAKRTAANPDLAAAIVRALSPLALKADDVVVVALSGSLVGANLAAFAAVETLRLRPIVVSSLAASMYGATDPSYTWADMEATLTVAGVIPFKSALLVAGGVGGVADDLSPEGRDMLRAAAHRHGGAFLEETSMAGLYRAVLTGIEREAESLGPVRAVINAGGAQIALGNCIEAAAFPTGLIRHALSCSDEVPGLVAEFSQRGVPVLHLLNMRRLAASWGLPYDPVEPVLIGNNWLIYGAAPRSEAGERG